MKYSWRCFNAVRIQTMDVGCEWVSEVRTCDSSSLIPPGYTRERCSVSFLTLHTRRCPAVAQAAVVSAGAGPAAGSHVKYLSERLRAAQPNTSHPKAQSRGIGKERPWEGPESKKLTFSRSLLPAFYRCVPMHSLSLEFTPSAVFIKKASLNFLILYFCMVPFVRVAHCWII